jgi:hypothetical protein
MLKITKAQARKLFEKGEDIYLNPSKMRPNGVWHQALKTNKEVLTNKLYTTPSFDALVNEYRYYNCTKETGLTVHFYKD